MRIQNFLGSKEIWNSANAPSGRPTHCICIHGQYLIRGTISNEYHPRSNLGIDFVPSSYIHDQIFDGTLVRASQASCVLSKNSLQHRLETDRNDRRNYFYLNVPSNNISLHYIWHENALANWLLTRMETHSKRTNFRSSGTNFDRFALS